MISLTNLDSQKLLEIIRDLINRSRNLNLKVWHGSSTFKPDFWQGYNDSENRKVVCEIKKDANLTDFDLLNVAFHQSEALINEYNPEDFILVFLRHVSQKDKNRLIDQFAQNIRSNIRLVDLSDLERILVAYPDIEKKYFIEVTNWHLAFRELAVELRKFYIKNGAKSGEELFKLCSSDQDFNNVNKRLAKVKRDFDLPGLDPIQVFGSLNESNMWDAHRTDRLNNFLKILGSKVSYKQIDYKGCPAPFSIKIMAARNASVQFEIWEFFFEVMERSQDALDEKIFRKIKGWYGIEISALTIFLFWIDSDNFLPIDKNTNRFLIEIGLYNKRPHSYFEYKDLIKQRSTNLYRKTAAYSYNQGLEPIVLSDFIKVTDEIHEKVADKKEDVSINEIRKVNFRLLALSGTETNDPNFLKVLTSDYFYSFYQCFNFNNENQIEYDKSKDYDIFNVREFDQKRPNYNLNINVSAVVGKNGSGKSTLTELLYMAINNLSCKILGHKSGLTYIPNLKIKLFYYTDTIYKVFIDGDKIEIIPYDKQGEIFYSSKDRIALTKEALEDFFYTVGINYSHFALNSEEFGQEWIHDVFHKNDGYQAPIVINPMRKKGIIDINLENSFVKQRLLSNILQPIGSAPLDKSLRTITDNKRSAKEIILTINPDKITYLYKNYNEKLIEFPSTDEINNVINEVYSFFKIPTDQNTELSKIADKYLFKKLVTISKNYDRYEKHFRTNTIEKSTILDYLIDLDNDPSHVAYKFKQAVNYLKFNHIKSFDFSKPISVDELSKAIEGVIEDNYSSVKPLKTIELIPPSFFKIDIILNDNSSFDRLSSGEKQRIHSVNSLIYHLTNLDSVDDSERENGDRDLKYPYINILFDEIELYFHPDMQRTFIDYLLNYLKRIQFEYLDGLNICFVTHSPFILSDIPAENVIFLTKPDKPENAKAIQKKSENKIKTFGANVYEILINGFFFENGFMGQYAKEKIESSIVYLREIIKANDDELIDSRFIIYNPDDWDKEKLEKFINTIGEPLLKNTLHELFNRAYRPVLDIDKEIERLLDLKSKRSK